MCSHNSSVHCHDRDILDILTCKCKLSVQTFDTCHISYHIISYHIFAESWCMEIRSILTESEAWCTHCVRSTDHPSTARTCFISISETSICLFSPFHSRTISLQRDLGTFALQLLLRSFLRRYLAYRPPDDSRKVVHFNAVLSFCHPHPNLQTAKRRPV